MLCYSSSALSAAVGTSESAHNYGHMQLYLLSQMINLALTRAESGGRHVTQTSPMALYNNFI